MLFPKIVYPTLSESNGGGVSESSVRVHPLLSQLGVFSVTNGVLG